MRKPYDPKAIETKWQEWWRTHDTYRAEDFSDKPKAYVLDMFPYPSGSGLHVGHPLGYIATDVLSRYFAMRGYNVLHPMGWDAFGLPAENFAIKNKIHPRVAVEQNIARFKEQLAMFGFSYDWSREINTTDPGYYKWTQWIFLQMFKSGLAYESKMPINWCPDCKTGLANEEVSSGACERCTSKVERRNIRQWMLKITEFADRLLDDLDELEWPERIKEMQRNWIGRSEGAEVEFVIKSKTVRRALIIHGFEGSSKEGWKSWLKAKLEDLGYEVSAPALPNADHPDFEETIRFLREETKSFGGHDVLIGHSLGALFALKLAEEKQFGNLILVAPAIGDLPFDDYRKEWVDSDVDSVQRVIKKNPLRMENIRAIRKTVLFGDEDRWIPKKLIKMFDSSWQVRMLLGRDHMSELKELPEVLDAVLTKLPIYTTRPDTLFGATYVVLSPEHKLVDELVGWEGANHKEVHAYVAEAQRKSDLERQEGREKTGIRVDKVVAINPVNGEELPVFVADYVLAHYGTGAIMAVPAHDDRDFEFATKFNLPVRRVISQDGSTDSPQEAYVGEGVMVNSGDFTGMGTKEGGSKIIEWLKKDGSGEAQTNYKLRDWVFSRQRYWGEPIPIVHCDKCGVVAVPEEQLPVMLPDVESYEPTGTGESPLAAMEEWVNVECPECAGPAKRETNTMPQWAGSCWYYLRYIDPKNMDAFVDPEKEKYWMPVDMYLGGAEHAVLHLLYARFWHKVLFDGGYVSTVEPFKKLFNQGMILGPDHQKMSKSRGNVINPDEVVDQYGADAFRLYEMFMGPLNQEKPWDTKGIVGLFRFLKKVYALVQSDVVEDVDEPSRHRLIEKVTKDIQTFDANTAISAMMEFVNIRTKTGASKEDIEILTILIAPFAPHLAEEIWQEVLHKEGSVYRAPWPDFDKDVATPDAVTIAVQVNGKLRGTLKLAKGASEGEAVGKAKELLAVAASIGENQIKRTVFVPNKIVNFIT